MPFNYVSLLTGVRRDPSRTAAASAAGKSVDKLGDIAIAVVRYTLGGVMFVHAAQKMFGWFGGPGFTAALQSFTQKLGIPRPIAILAILTEFLASVGLFVGFLGRISALG